MGTFFVIETRVICTLRRIQWSSKLVKSSTISKPKEIPIAFIKAISLAEFHLHREGMFQRPMVGL
jgi:hypothetical protein